MSWTFDASVLRAVSHFKLNMLAQLAIEKKRGVYLCVYTDGINLTGLQLRKTKGNVTALQSEIHACMRSVIHSFLAMVSTYGVIHKRTYVEQSQSVRTVAMMTAAVAADAVVDCWRLEQPLPHLNLPIHYYCMQSLLSRPVDERNKFKSYNINIAQRVSLNIRDRWRTDCLFVREKTDMTFPFLRNCCLSCCRTFIVKTWAPKWFACNSSDTE